MSRLVRAPLLHFLVLGALLFGAEQARRGAADEEDRARRPIAIDAERMDQLTRHFAAQTGRRPSAREIERLVSRDIEEEILYREAIARGLFERDGGVQTRLIQKMLFLESGSAIEDAPRLLARALELGLHHDDVVVRRILVQKMRLIGSALAPQQRPTEAEIRAVYHAERDSLRAPDRRTLVHVFLSRDRHGAQTESQARRLAERLRTETIATEVAVSLGDPFPLGHRLERRSQGDLARQFGGDFGDAAFAQTPGRWSDPIPSAYGNHLVLVEEALAGEIPPFEAVAERLRLRIEEERRTDNLAALLADLRSRYEVVPPTDTATMEAG